MMTDPATLDPALLPDIEHEFRRASPFAFSPQLEAVYEAREGAQRRNRQARGARIAAYSGLASIILDFVAHAGSARWILSIRLAQALICFGAAMLLRRSGRPWTTGVSFSLPCAAMIAAIELLGLGAPAGMGDRYVLMAPMGVAALLVMLPLEVWTGGVAAVSSLTIFTLILWLFPSSLPLSQNLDFPVGTAIVFAITMISVSAREQHRRAAFLLTLRYELAAIKMNLLNCELERTSNTDALTGLANRRRFEGEAKRLWRDRAGQGLAMILIDVDKFKAYNDTAGHAEGDICLCEIAGALAAVVRSEDDLAARFGGEEFVVFLPRVGLKDAMMIAERLRAGVQDLALPHPGLGGAAVTISVGVAWRDAENCGSSALDVLREADEALYAAKHAGRNRVVLAKAKQAAH